MSEIEEDFSDLCNVDTFNKVLDNLAYYQAQGDMRAVDVFESARKEALQKCGFVIRSIDKRRYNGQTKDKKYTMRNLEVFELSQDGKLSVPERPTPPKIPDPKPMCMVMLEQNEKEREKKNGNE